MVHTLTLDNLYQWDVQILISDSVGGSTTYNYTLDKGIPIVFYDKLKRSVGVNSFPSDDASLEISGINILEKLNHIGKELWTGTFTTGTLNVPNLSDYTIICIYVNNVMMIGNQYYGGTSFRGYRSISIANWGYRFTYDSTNETLSTDTDNPGASDGTNQLTITKIVGLI